MEPLPPEVTDRARRRQLLQRFAAFEQRKKDLQDKRREMVELAYEENRGEPYTDKPNSVRQIEKRRQEINTKLGIVDARNPNSERLLTALGIWIPSERTLRYVISGKKIKGKEDRQAIDLSLGQYLAYMWASGYPLSAARHNATLFARNLLQDRALDIAAQIEPFKDRWKEGRLGFTIQKSWEFGRVSERSQAENYVIQPTPVNVRIRRFRQMHPIGRSLDHDLILDIHIFYKILPSYSDQEVSLSDETLYRLASAIRECGNWNGLAATGEWICHRTSVGIMWGGNRNETMASELARALTQVGFVIKDTSFSLHDLPMSDIVPTISGITVSREEFEALKPSMKLGIDTGRDDMIYMIRKIPKNVIREVEGVTSSLAEACEAAIDELCKENRVGDQGTRKSFGHPIVDCLKALRTRSTKLSKTG